MVSGLINDTLQTNDAIVSLRLHLLLHAEDTVIMAESETELRAVFVYLFI